MNQLFFAKAFCFLGFVKLSESGLTFEGSNWNITCDNRVAGVIEIAPKSSEHFSGLNFTLKREISNLNMRARVQLPNSNTNIIDCTLNFCSNRSRSQNVFTRIFFENTVGLSEDSKNATNCPLKKGFYIYGSNPKDYLSKHAQKYVPTYVQKIGKFEVKLTLFSVKAKINSFICEVIETITLKFN